MVFAFKGEENKGDEDKIVAGYVERLPAFPMRHGDAAREIIGGHIEMLDVFPIKQDTPYTCGIACVAAMASGETPSKYLLDWFYKVKQNAEGLLTYSNGMIGMDILTLAKEIDEVYNKRVLLFKSRKYRIEVYTIDELLDSVYNGENKRDGSALDGFALERDKADLDHRGIAVHYSSLSPKEIIGFVSNGNYVVYEKDDHWVVAYGVLHISYSDGSMKSMLMTMDPLIGNAFCDGNAIDRIREVVLAWAKIEGRGGLDAKDIQAIVVDPGVSLKRTPLSASTLNRAGIY
ncbi:MAG: hypothetical protein QW393_04320 [Candidatus Micrarchaeaceae archaeon]